MPGIDLEGSDTGRIIHGGILKTANFLPISPHEIEKFHISLDLMTWNLFLVALGQYGPCFGIPRETIHPIPFENLINPSRGYLDPVVALQKPGNSQLSQMICLSKIENLFFDFWWDTQGRIFRTRLTIDQSFFSIGSTSFSPLMKSLPGYSEVTASLRDITNPLSISEDTELSSNLTLNPCHQ
jgi:hypothetical protein